MSRAVLVPPDFNPVPSASRTVSLDIAELGTSGPGRSGALGIPVPSAGEPPKILGLDRDALARGGFDGKPGQALVLPEPDGRLRVAVGIGDGVRFIFTSPVDNFNGFGVVGVILSRTRW